jgi:DNA-binding NarL/FixJ family response regulator
MLTRIPGRLVAVPRSPVSREHPPAPHSASPQANSDINSVGVNLTPRQREVLAVMMQGKSNKAICWGLGLAEPTVKNHVTAILKALSATNRTEAVVAATALGLDVRQDAE